MSEKSSLPSLHARFDKLKKALPDTSLICQGSVVKRHLSRQEKSGLKTYGPYYIWTRKIDNKTVTVNLTLQQYQALKKAIRENKKLEKSLAQMRSLAEHIILKQNKS